MVEINAKNVAIGLAAGAVVGIAAPFVATAAIGAAGFGAGGVIAGSTAAGIQSGIGSVAAGSIFAGIDSVSSFAQLTVSSGEPFQNIDY
jgi:hypothetical protein